MKIFQTRKTRQCQYVSVLLNVDDTNYSVLFVLLVRLLRVHLIKWVSNVRLSVRPQKVSSISMKFGM